jgi:UDP-glucose 4-epimerase
MKILVTGGAGYIGSHACVSLMQAGHEAVVLDNLSNSKRSVLPRLEKITGGRIDFVEGDIRDRSLLAGLFRQRKIDGVMHFAGLKAVGESVEQPLRYYQNNVSGTLTLCEAMVEAGVKLIIFSSSATVYGEPAKVPITEDFPVAPTNPYGHSKLMVEDILRDLWRADSHWRIALLRYFNPVGAHISGTIGEDPNGIPNNLVPYVSQVAVGRLKQLNVFGSDYPTPDGTGVRDYIHVVDLADGHVRALERLVRGPAKGGATMGELLTVNLGTGRGYSVLEVVKAFEAASGRKVPYQVVARRAGDIAVCFADPALAEKEFGWVAKRGLAEMCADSWRWQQQNPAGYP